MAALVPSYALKARDVRSAGRFPSVGLEAFNMVLHLVGITIASAMLSRKLPWIVQFLSWLRILVLVNHAAAWAFFFTISILVDSLGMENSEVVCMLGILSCIFFYICTKLTIYLFLAEKVYVVWSIGPERGRLQCKVYLASLAFIVSYPGIGVLWILQRIAYIRGDGSCVIGISRLSSTVNISYDVFVNIFLTFLFVRPLLANRLTPALRAVARRSLWAATIALTGSCINMIILAATNGKELGWVCLACCASDVILNAATMYWVTSGNYDSPREQEVGTKTVALNFAQFSDAVSDVYTSLLHSIRLSRHSRDSHSHHHQPSHPSMAAPEDAATSHRATAAATMTRSTELHPGTRSARDHTMSKCSEVQHPTTTATTATVLDDIASIDERGPVVDGTLTQTQTQTASRPQSRMHTQTQTGPRASSGRGFGHSISAPRWVGSATSPVPHHAGRTTSLGVVETKQATAATDACTDERWRPDPSSSSSSSPRAPPEPGPSSRCDPAWSTAESRETKARAARGSEAQREREKERKKDDGVR